jgi:hypothetical protein
MNKNIIIIAAIILVIAGGGVYFLSTKNKNSASPSESIPNNVVSNANSQSKERNTSEQTAKQSIKNLLTSGVAQKCTYKDDSDDVNVEGAAYIANGKMRGDFSTSIEGKTTNGHMIYDGKTSYIWTDGMNTGFKMDIDINKEQPTEKDTTQGLDINKDINYTCSPWVIDQSQFTPPTTVNFSTFAIPSTVPSADSSENNKEACSACNSLSGAAKTQCLTMLKCN